MSIRVGSVEIRATQRVEAVETRTLLALRVPGQAGGVQQNLGREPVVLAVEGLLYGADAQRAVESLRAAYSTGAPQPFAGDIAVGVEFTDVIVEDLRLVQVAGTLDRFQTSLRLREHVVPPEPLGAGLLGVDAELLKELAGWAEVAMAVARVAQDPASLLDELRNNKHLRERLGVAAVERLACEAGAELLGVSPEQVQEWAGQMVDNADAIVEGVQAVVDSPDLLPRLLDVAARATRLVGRFADGSLARALQGEGPRAADQVVGDIRELVSAIQALLQERALRVFVRSVVRTLGLVRNWNEAVESAAGACARLAVELRALRPWLAQADTLVAAIELVSPAIGGVTGALGAFGGSLRDLGAPAPPAGTSEALAEVQGHLDWGAAYVNAVLPTPRAIQDLAQALEPGLVGAVRALWVEGP